MNIYIIFVYFVPKLATANNYIEPLIIACIFISIGTFTILDNSKTKRFTSIISVLSGVFLSIIMTEIFMSILKISGLVSEEYNALLTISSFENIDIRGIFFSAVIISSLGAVMDISMTITSAAQEIIKYSPTINYKLLFRSSLKIGNDTITTMGSTLILAYISGTLPLAILLNVYQYSWVYLINSEWFAAEIVKSSVGILSLLLVVPITSLYVVAEHKIRYHVKIQKGELENEN